MPKFFNCNHYLCSFIKLLRRKIKKLIVVFYFIKLFDIKFTKKIQKNVHHLLVHISIVTELDLLLNKFQSCKDDL